MFCDVVCLCLLTAFRAHLVHLRFLLDPFLADFAEPVAYDFVSGLRAVKGGQVALLALLAYFAVSVLVEGFRGATAVIDVAFANLDGIGNGKPLGALSLAKGEMTRSPVSDYLCR